MPEDLDDKVDLNFYFYIFRFKIFNVKNFVTLRLILLAMSEGDGESRN